jgi:hypothetical protein
MLTLKAMRETLGDPGEFQRATMAHYRGVLLDMLQDPVYRPQRSMLFDPLRVITDWQRANTDDFTRFYEDYRFITERIGNVINETDTGLLATQRAAAAVYGEVQA